MYQDIMIKGIVPPIPTPLHADETLDEEATTRIVELHLNAGVDAIWGLGTTGRFDLVTDGVQRRFAELVAERVNGQVPLVLNVSEMGTQRVLEKAKRFDDLPYDVFSALCPWYQAIPAPHMTGYFHRLADELSRPLLIYNAPWVVNQLSFDHLQKLAEHPRIIGAKDVTEQYSRPQLWTRAERQALDFSYLIGGSLVSTSAAMEADGSVTALSAVFPELCVATWKAVQEGNHVEAARYQRQITFLTTAFDRVHSVPATQVMCRHRGLGHCIAGHPFEPLDDTLEAQVLEIVKASGVLD